MMIMGAEDAAARGAGIVAGEGRLHPSLDLELAYDTNPGYFPNNSSNKTGDMLLRIRPGITILYPSDIFSVDVTGMVGYDWYFGIINKDTRKLSSIVASGDLKFGFNPKGQVSFFLEDTLSRSGDPQYTSLTGKFNRTDNEVKAHLQIKPGGQALTFDLAYGFFLDYFDIYREYSSYAHRIYFSAKWKFLPKTALIVDADADLRRYLDVYPDGTRNIDINGIRATVGLQGQITSKIGLMVKVGYGDTLLVKPATYTGSDFRSVVGQAEIEFRSGTTFLQGGYLRNFQPVMFFAFFGQDRFYVNFIQQIAGKFSIKANVGFDLLNYGTDIRPTPGSRRWDNALAGNLIVDYNILDWLNVGLRYDFQALFSKYKQPISETLPLPAGVDYNKHVISLFVVLDY
jgi:Uncharacterized protein conserved in bacteria (DUF2320).